MKRPPHLSPIGPERPDTREAARINRELHENDSPEWWAVTDEDLAELDPTRPSAWELLADTELGRGK